MSAPPRILIAGATALTLDSKDTTEVLDIRIEQGRIVALAPKLPRRGVDRLIEAKGMVVMPGLVQAHVHLCQTLFRGMADDMELMQWLQQRIWPLEAAHTAETLRASARLGLAELLLGGTTAVLDMGTVRHTDVLFEEAERLGIRYTGGKTLMDLGQGFASGLKEESAVALAESVQLCERWHGRAEDRLRYAFAPRFVVSCSDETLRGCLAAARQRGALLHTHASETTEEVRLVRDRTGMGNVEFLHSLGFCGADVVLAHGIWLSSHEQKLLRESHTHVVHCPSSNLKLASGIARVDELLEQGVNVALGADGAACANSLDAFTELRLLGLLHKLRGGPTAVPARQALRVATQGGAKALGLAAAGSIALGNVADLIILDMHRPHLFPAMGDLHSRIVYAAQRSDVHTVVVAGRVVVAAGELQTGDAVAIMNDAQAAAHTLVARAAID